MSNTEPLVSVIMPAYNAGKTIQLALNSLYNQSYENWECLVVNDCSTDNTKEILDRASDPRVRIHHFDKNRGRSAARNKAIEMASGKYMSFLDSDDFLHEDKIRRQVEILESDSEIYLVSCSALCFGDKGTPQNILGSPKNDGIRKISFKDGNPLPIMMPSSMIRTTEAKRFNYNSSLEVGEDFDYFSRYLDGHLYVVTGDLHYFYYVQETKGPKILSYSWKSIFSGIALMKRRFMSGLRLTTTAVAKTIVYAITLPIVGSQYYMRRRGIPSSSHEQMEFIATYVKLTKDLHKQNTDSVGEYNALINNNIIGGG